MSHNKMYRSFIILQEDEKGHSITADKQVSGYAKIEVKNGKCKISFYAQNIDENKGKCNIVLISGKKDIKKIINLGGMNINAQGKGEAFKEYDDTNIAGLNVGYDKITGAAICIMKGNKVGCVMCGFMNGEQPKDNWKEFEIISKKENNPKVEEEKINKEIYEENLKIQKEYELEEALKKDIAKQEEKNKELVQKEVQEENIESGIKDVKNNDISNIDGKRYEEIEEDITVEENSEEYDRVKEELESKKRKVRDEKEKLERMLRQMEKEESEIENLENEVNDNERHHKKGCKEKKHKCKDKKYKDNEVELELECECECECECELKKEEDKKSTKKSKSCREDDDVIEVDCEENKFDKYEQEIEYRNAEENFEVRGSVGEFFELLAEDLEVVRGKHQEIKYCKWYKVPVPALDDMCNASNYNKYTVIYYPMINYYPYIRKYGHFVVGYKCDQNGKMKYIVYGIPGKKDKSEQPYCGKTGFVSWIKDDDMGPDMGYWLMFYDFRNSVIVVPME